jgi:hypothetical protein
MSNGKGDKRRPASVSDDELRLRWARAFGSCHHCGAPRERIYFFHEGRHAMCRDCVTMVDTKEV